MTEIPEVELKSGESMPVLGFGTWNLGGKEVRSLEGLPREEKVYIIDLDDETYGIPS